MSVENLTLKDLQEFSDIAQRGLTIKEYKRELKKLGDKHKLTDQEALEVYGKAKAMEETE